MSSPSQREAAARVQLALKHLERAQHEIEDAATELSAVVGLSSDWARLIELYENTRGAWHRVNGREGPFDLDAAAKEALERKVGAK